MTDGSCTVQNAIGGTIVVRILAVEDNPRDVALLSAQLQLEADGRWCELHAAGSLAEAQQALRRAPVDVILLDLNLPDSKGWDTFEGVQLLAPETAVILLSGEDHEELAAKAVKHGAQDYLSKTDLSGSTLRRAVRYAVERKAGEQQLLRYQENLEELVRSRTERIQQTNDALRREVEERRRAEEELRRAMALLREHDEARAQFVSNVSHELKTPLASMSYAVDNMLKGVVGDMSDGCRSYVVMLGEDCERLIRTVSDVLDLSRIESGSLALHRVRLPFHRFVEHTVTSLGMLAGEKGLSVRLDLLSVKAFVDCDPHKIERVILNVVQNAIKYTGKGGAIGVELRRTDGADAQLVLSVSDTGVGIPGDCLSRITERYFRVGENVHGAGLGLAIAKEIIERHGGRLEILSPVPGRTCGTQVNLLLPEAPAPRVVVAVGDTSVRDGVSFELSSEGYDLLVQPDGDSAWSALANGDVPHAMVMDFLLPGMDNVELMARVKSDPRLQRLPLIMAVDKAVDGVRSELIEGFRLPCVTVPLHEGEILKAVEQATQGRAHAEL